jgi:hypothetical protein
MSTLIEFFSKIPDPRNPSGRRYSLTNVFVLLVSGLASKNFSLKRIVMWGRSLPVSMCKLMGFNKGIPSIATLSNLLRRLDIKSIEAALGEYNSVNKVDEHVALDGKTLRGTKQDSVPLVHLLSLFVVKYQKVIAQIKMQEGENEISAAIRFLKEVDIEGTIITGDAIFAKKKSVKQY